MNEIAEPPVANARNPRKNNPEKTREDILRAAIAEFVSEGLSGARVDAIAERTHTSKRMIYHHFGSKEQLAAALYADGLAAYQDGVRAILARAPAAAPGVRALVRHHLRWAQANPALARFLLERRSLEVREAGAARVAELNEPGRGLAFVVPVEKVVGVPHIAAGKTSGTSDGGA